MRHVSDNTTTNVRADVVGILDELEEAAPLPKGPKCGVAAALERIAAEDKAIGAKVAERVDDTRVAASALASILTKRTGVTISGQTVRRHRNRGDAVRGCRCPR